MKKLFIILTLFFLSTSVSWALTDQDKVELLTFVKDYLLLESKDSGIFELVVTDAGEKQWFELYGILSDIKTKDDVHTVIVDADVFGYSDINYLLYFDVKKINGRWIMADKRVGPRHQRQLTDENLSLPN